jgi:hypothetical protein
MIEAFFRGLCGPFGQHKVGRYAATCRLPDDVDGSLQQRRVGQLWPSQGMSEKKHVHGFFEQGMCQSINRAHQHDPQLPDIQVWWLVPLSGVGLEPPTGVKNNDHGMMGHTFLRPSSIIPPTDGPHALTSPSTHCRCGWRGTAASNRTAGHKFRNEWHWGTEKH